MNDFELRNYDPQIGRWIQQDPYQEYASPYVGMGNDPVSNVDPSGGGIFDGLTVVGRLTVTALGGAILGGIAGELSGDDSYRGSLIGAVAGLGIGINPSITSLVLQSANIAGTVINTSTTSRQVGNMKNGLNTVQQAQNIPHGPASGSDFGQNEKTSEIYNDDYPPQKKLPDFKTLKSNYPLPYKIRPDRTPIDSRKPLNDLTGANFLYFNQCSIRMSIALRKSGVDISGAENVTNAKAGTKGAFGNGNILGAKNLTVFLRKFENPTKYDGTKTDVVSKLKDKTGIIYFENFVENGRRSTQAVHIDLWDKTQYMSPFPFTQMFDAKTILFWEIK